MNCTIKLNCDNAAFGGDSFGPEVARILRELADKMETATAGDIGLECLRDVNGNKVGTATIHSV